MARTAEVVRPAATDPAALRSAAVAVDAIIVRTFHLPAEVLASAHRLRVVGKHGVGIDNIDVAAATERGIVVLTTPNANAASVAEFTLASMLVLLRRIFPGRDALRSGAFARDRSVVGQLADAGLLGGELAGRRVGVVGFGAIGRRVTAILVSLGSSVLVHDPYVPDDEVVAAGASPSALDDLLSISDIVTLHVPATDSTAGLIDRRALGLMQSHAIVVNTSRASVVDEEALVDALREGTIAAAAVDVFVDEPPPPDHPLLALENALCTPHLAGTTLEASRRMADDVVQGVLDVLAGRVPGGIVNPEVLSRLPRAG